MLEDEVVPIAALHGELPVVTLCCVSLGLLQQLRGVCGHAWEAGCVHLELPGEVFQNVFHMAGPMHDPL